MQIKLPLAALAVGSAGFVGLASVAHADSSDVGWGSRVTVDGSIAGTSTLQEAGNATISDLGQINPSLAGMTGSISTNAMRYRDALRVGRAFGYELNYRNDSGLEPFVRVNYARQLGRTVSSGSISEDQVGTVSSITENFSDVTSGSLNIGSRYFFMQYSRLQPFVSGYIGATRTGSVRADVSAPDAQLDLGTVTLLPAATRADAGLETGIDVRVNDGLTVGLTVGAKYLAHQDANTAALNALGSQGTPVHGQNWSYPAELGLSYHF
jgi:hypothetical protein